MGEERLPLRWRTTKLWRCRAIAWITHTDTGVRVKLCRRPFHHPGRCR